MLDSRRADAASGLAASLAKTALDAAEMHNQLQGRSGDQGHVEQGGVDPVVTTAGAVDDPTRSGDATVNSTTLLMIPEIGVAVKAHALPPIDLLNPPGPGGLYETAVTDRCRDHWIEAPGQEAQRPEAAVMLGIVTRQHERNLSLCP